MLTDCHITMQYLVKRQYRLLLLLLLLLTLNFYLCVSECINYCEEVNQNLTSILVRTWQPDGDCQLWPNGRSETNRFPAAVRSGHRWLVMQLRQPMVLDRVSVRGRDGQWQAAGAVGSPVSAVGAASLPLELQLEDPCRASWEAFGSSDGWRQLGEMPVSFLLLNSSQSLRVSSVRLNGTFAPLQVEETRNTFCPNCSPLTWRIGDTIEFSVSSCGLELPICSVRLTDGSQRNASQVGWAMYFSCFKWPQINHFEFTTEEGQIPRALVCSQGSSAGLRIERAIAVAYVSNNHTLSVSPVMVSGRPVSVEFASHGMFPRPEHSCSVTYSTGHQGLALLSETQSIFKDNKGRVLYSVVSQFQFEASETMTGGLIQCSTSASHKVKKWLNIANISEPCQTAIDLGSSRYWTVGQTSCFNVTSSRCSIWNVSHSCWLLLGDAAPVEMLHKVQQSSFSSAHELQVSELMAHLNWSIRCSVNQSGVSYEHAAIVSDQQPLILYPASIAIQHASVDASRLLLTVSSSGGRPPVTSVVCEISSPLAANQTVELSESINSGIWTAEPQLPMRWCSNHTEVTALCTAVQILNTKLVFQTTINVAAQCPRKEFVATIAIDSVLWAMIACLLLLTLTLCVSALSCALTRRSYEDAINTLVQPRVDNRHFDTFPVTSQLRHDTRTELEMQQLAPHDVRSQGSSAYDYPIFDSNAYERGLIVLNACGKLPQYCQDDTDIQNQPYTNLP